MSLHLPRRGRQLVTALLVLASAGCAGTSKNPSSPSPSPDPNAPIYYTAIGASDAAGVGGSVPCLPFTLCPDGTSYVAVIARALAQDGRTVTLMNMGIPGAVLSPRIEALGNSLGRNIPANFIENEAPFTPRGTTHVTIFAGGNDTNTVASAVGNGAGGGNVEAYIDQQIREFSDDLQTLLRIVRERAPAARLVVANLPNFAGMPYTAGYSAADKRIMQRISVGFSTQAINPLAAQGIAVVDLLCDPRFLQPSIYSADGFHPNDTGYAMLAAEMLKALTQANYPAPQTSCSQMFLAGS